MKLKDRIKTYNFWVSLSSAIFLIIKVLGNQVGFKVDESLFSDLITSLCSILVILGIIVPPTKIVNKDSNLIDDNSSEKILANNIVDLDASQEETTQSLENSLTETYNLQQINSINDTNLTEQKNIDNVKPIENEENSTFDNIISESNNEAIEQFSDKVQINNEKDESIENELEKAIFDNQPDNSNNIETKSTNQIEFTKSKFQNQLKIQENLFANNIEEYIKILEIELESLKNK